jgi:hypothetical protein
MNSLTIGDVVNKISTTEVSTVVDGVFYMSLIFISVIAAMVGVSVIVYKLRRKKW